MHHLLHRGVVVGANHGLDVEMFVVFFRRFHRLEHHAGGHSIAAADVRVVEALYLVRQLGQVQFLLQLLHQSGLFLLRIQLLGLFQAVKFVLFAVHDAQVEQGFLVAALWNGEGDAFQLHIQLLGDNDFLGLALETLA